MAKPTPYWATAARKRKAAEKHKLEATRLSREATELEVLYQMERAQREASKRARSRAFFRPTLRACPREKPSPATPTPGGC